VPAEVTYCPLSFFKVCWQHVVVYCDEFGLQVTRLPCVDFLFPCEDTAHDTHGNKKSTQEKTSNMQSELITINYDMLPAYFEK